MRGILRRRLMGLLRSERGAALVEFALVVPFLILVMCATIDFGLAVFTLNNLTTAVREGGRFAAVVPAPGPVVNDATVCNVMYRNLANMNTGLDSAQIMATMTVTPPDASGFITVKITGYPYKPMTPLASLLGLSTLTLNRSAIFRWERSS